MINEISINSSNAIQLSRGQLLAWLNELLNINITKIQQLGAGSIYCQMLDVLYPGKVQLSKVNFKAKNDYQYINNFKILQQSFTKFGIMKHIQVEKLIKCKYQDNLEFLQWFRKIFDNSHSSKNDFEVLSKKSVSENDYAINLEKQNKRPTRALNFNQTENDKNSIMQDLLKLQLSKQNNSKRSSMSKTSRNNEKKVRQSQLNIKPSTDRNNSFFETKNSTYQNEQRQKSKNQEYALQKANIIESTQKQPYYSPSKYIQKQNIYKISSESQGICNQEKQFYLKKFKEIEHIMEIWSSNEGCSKMISEIRKVIFFPPQIKDWIINEQTGEVAFLNQPNKNLAKQVQALPSNAKDISKFEEE